MILAGFVMTFRCLILAVVCELSCSVILPGENPVKLFDGVCQCRESWRLRALQIGLHGDRARMA